MKKLIYILACTGLLATFTGPMDAVKARGVLAAWAVLTGGAMVAADVRTGLAALVGAGLACVYYVVTARRQFGGVTGDLAGFAAATLLRGVALVQAPTTLLAQVDSAVGGKTGLDLPEGKNLLGCFYQPRMVLADTVCLATLPRRQLACCMAEVIKYGCIADEELLTRLEQQETDWPRIIRRCLACKAALVAQDERDEGPRRLLNFGHTFGHAMEALGDGRYTHGECVAAGMMEMLRWQTAHGSDQTAMLARLGTLLERYDLPRRLDLPETAWRQYLLRDKKRSGGEMTIAVLERPGHGVLWSVTPEELLEETRWM